MAQCAISVARCPRQTPGATQEAKRGARLAGTGGDDMEDDFDGDSSDGGSSDSSEEGYGPLQKRQRTRAAGDHELQASLRSVLSVTLLSV